MRPNLHVEDMVDAYEVMLDAPHEKIHGEVFNIGYENHSIADIALMVKRVVEEAMPDLGEIQIETTPSNDNRAYHVTSDKRMERRRAGQECVRKVRYQWWR